MSVEQRAGETLVAGARLAVEQLEFDQSHQVPHVIDVLGGAPRAQCAQVLNQAASGSLE